MPATPLPPSRSSQHGVFGTERARLVLVVVLVLGSWSPHRGRRPPAEGPIPTGSGRRSREEDENEDDLAPNQPGARASSLTACHGGAGGAASRRSTVAPGEARIEAPSGEVRRRGTSRVAQQFIVSLLPISVIRYPLFVIRYPLFGREHRPPNTEHRPPNTKHRTPNSAACEQPTARGRSGQGRPARAQPGCPPRDPQVGCPGSVASFSRRRPC